MSGVHFANTTSRSIARPLRPYYEWIVERHEMYRKRALGEPYPWSKDNILNKYKFTNPFRENDAVTIWMRESFRPIYDEEATLQNNIINAALFRMVGTTEFAGDFLQHHGWITPHRFDPKSIKHIIQIRLAKKQKCFTGAYIVTNQGIKAPKSQVVIDNFITPLWESLNLTLPVTNPHTFNCKRTLHHSLSQFRGFGGGGFMAYEVVCDALHTPAYVEKHGGFVDMTKYSNDRYRWSNAGPGAIRGLNRIFELPHKARMSQKEALVGMRHIIGHKYLAHDIAKEKGYKPIEFKHIDMRCIEHSLCEFDKYMRVKENQGRPRSVCKYKVGVAYPIRLGPVE